jgi:hypothetical protein
MSLPTLKFTALFALVLVFLAGCSDGPGKAGPVDPAKAKKTLETTLNAWKAGKKIEALAQEEPPIVAQDFDWMAGKKLASFQVQGDGAAQDANLRIPVKLSLQEGDGETVDKTVIYIVGTDIKLTVFRALE